jgi:hypothetical protein
MSKFKLYDSTGITLIYTFPCVQRTNAPQSKGRYIGIEGVRGTGKLVIPAGTESWDLEIEGVLYIDPASGEDYEDLVKLIDKLETDIALNTPYYLRIEKTSSTYYEYKVKRLESIDYPESLRKVNQRYICRFSVNAW